MAEHRDITEAQLEAALRKVGGVYSLAAEQLNTSRQNVQQRVERSAHLKSVCTDIKERTLDIVDGQLLKLIQKGDAATIRWYAERQGKSRGYGNSVDLGLSGEAVERIVAGLGGDLEKLRALRGRLGS